MLYYFILAHQADFDVVWCKGTVGEQIFKPWVNKIEEKGGKVLTGRRVSEIVVDSSSGKVSSIKCKVGEGEEEYTPDAVIMAVGINGVKVSCSNEVLKRCTWRW